METDRGRDMGDEERVEEVINVKSQFSSGGLSIGLGGAAAEDGGPVLTGAKGSQLQDGEATPNKAAPRSGHWHQKSDEASKCGTGGRGGSFPEVCNPSNESVDPWQD